jgi:hypothetical protein
MDCYDAEWCPGDCDDCSLYADQLAAEKRKRELRGLGLVGLGLLLLVLAVALAGVR